MRPAFAFLGLSLWITGVGGVLCGCATDDVLLQLVIVVDGTQVDAVSLRLETRFETSTEEASSVLERGWPEDPDRFRMQLILPGDTTRLEITARIRDASGVEVARSVSARTIDDGPGRYAWTVVADAVAPPISDSGVEDSGNPDGGNPDAGNPDAGNPDAGDAGVDSGVDGG